MDQKLIRPPYEKGENESEVEVTLLPSLDSSGQIPILLFFDQVLFLLCVTLSSTTDGFRKSASKKLSWATTLDCLSEWVLTAMSQRSRCPVTL